MDSALTLRYLESVAIRAIALFAIAAAVMTLFRVKSAGARHAFWTLVAAGMLLIAVTQPSLPRIAWRILDAAPAAQAMPALRTGASVTIAPVTTRHVEQSAFPWETALTALWAAGALLLLGRLAYGYGFTLRMVRAAHEVEPGVWESDWIGVPVTVASKIVLPAGWRDWSMEKRDAVMAHERAHVRRRDWAIALMAAVNRAVFWFHPLSWWLARRLASLAEEACDDAALASVGSREAYAQALVEIAAALKGGAGRVVWEGMAMAQVSEVRTRVERILDDARELSPRVSWKRWVAMSVCALPIVWLASVVHLARVQAATPVDTPADMAVEQEQDVAGREARMKAAQEKLRALEAEIARFKSENIGKLPSQFWPDPLRLAPMELGNVNEALSRLQSQKMQLEVQLLNATTLLNYGRASNDATRAALNQRIQELYGALAAAKELYTPSHPQIKKIEASISALEKQLEIAQKPSESRNGQERDLEAELSLLKNQLETTTIQMEEKLSRRHTLEARIRDLTERLELEPKLEHQYAELMREYQRAKQQLEETSITGPSLLSRTEPEPAGIQGKVELSVTIGTDGVPRDMQVLHSPDPALNQRAMDCVAKWRFRPALRGGQTITTFATVEVNFK